MKRYFVSILIGVCMGPMMYAKGCYLHANAPAAPTVTAQATS